MIVMEIGLSGGAAVMDMGGMAVKVVKDAMEERIIAENGTTSRSIFCETTVLRSSYSKPIVTFLYVVYCSGPQLYDSYAIEIPVNVSGIPVTYRDEGQSSSQDCDAEMFLTSVNCFGVATASARYLAPTLYERFTLIALEYTELYSWSACTLEGLEFCGHNFVDQITITEYPDEGTFEEELVRNSRRRSFRTANEGRLRGAVASVFCGAQDLDILFDRAFSKIENDSESANGLPVPGFSAVFPLLSTLMKGSFEILTSLERSIPHARAVRNQMQASASHRVDRIPDTAAPSATPSPSIEAAPPAFSPSPSPQLPQCIDAVWIAANHGGYEVHPESILADVLCFGALPCATSGHVVVYGGALKTMAELCALKACTRSMMHVNGVQHVRSALMPCDNDVCVTTLDAGSNTIWKRAENRLVYFLLEHGGPEIAQSLTRIQLSAADHRRAPVSSTTT